MKTLKEKIFWSTGIVLSAFMLMGAAPKFYFGKYSLQKDSETGSKIRQILEEEKYREFMEENLFKDNNQKVIYPSTIFKIEFWSFLDEIEI